MSEVTAAVEAALHHRCSPSGWAKWGVCTASIDAEKPFHGKDDSSIHSVTGSAAHWVGEDCLASGHDAAQYLGKIYTDTRSGIEVQVDTEMVEHVQNYVDYCRAIGRKYLMKGGEVVQRVEQRIDLNDYIPGGFGTADFLLFHPDSGTLVVVDLKYGKGVQVFAENNGQGMIYALGAAKEMELFGKVKNVIICIFQPRLDHVDEWEIPYE